MQRRQEVQLQLEIVLKDCSRMTHFKVEISLQLFLKLSLSFSKTVSKVNCSNYRVVHDFVRREGLLWSQTSSLSSVIKGFTATIALPL